MRFLNVNFEFGGVAATFGDALGIGVTDIDFSVNGTDLVTSFAIAEDAPLGTLLGTILHVAQSAPENYFPLSPLLELADTFGVFSLDGAALSLTGFLDFEIIPSYDIIIKAVDMFGGVFEQAIQVTVTNVNEAPLAAPLTASIGEDDPAFSSDLLIGASDFDQGTVLTVQNLDALVTTAGGRTLMQGSDYTLFGSTLALTAAGFAKFNSLSGSQFDQAIFQFAVSDGALATPDTLTLAIGGANDAPSLVNQTPNQTATAGAPFSLALPANTFQDIDNGDHLTLSATLSNGTALPSWLTLTPLPEPSAARPALPMSEGST